MRTSPRHRAGSGAVPAPHTQGGGRRCWGGWDRPAGGGDLGSGAGPHRTSWKGRSTSCSSHMCAWNVGPGPAMDTLSSTSLKRSKPRGQNQGRGPTSCSSKPPHHGQRLRCTGAGGPPSSTGHCHPCPPCRRSVPASQCSGNARPFRILSAFAAPGGSLGKSGIRAA